MSSKTSLKQMASEIVERCKLLSSSRVGEVESLLGLLSERRSQKGNSRSTLNRDQYYSDLYSSKDTIDTSAPPSMASIDEYIECLYEGVKEKVFATTKILQLALIPQNMESLLRNGKWHTQAYK